jgi:hypothetical protein
MQKSNIEIPVSLIEEDLTISEIGAIVVLLASISDINWSVKRLWNSDRSFVKTIANLQREGIVSYDEEGEITIDFNKKN